MRRIYELLLRLYPPEVRTEFGPEMSAVFAEVATEQRKQGRMAFLGFVLAELAGLMTAAAGEHLARRRTELDLCKMRPPWVSREVYAAALDEVIAAQRMVDFNLGRMQQAIGRCDFLRARFYSDEDRKAREHLRVVRRRYGIGK